MNAKPWLLLAAAIVFAVAILVALIIGVAYGVERMKH